LIDVIKLLNEANLEVPEVLDLQFDNCGENKNKVMFSYLSLLVEQDYFKEINVGFLVVGHTHSSIDQYFSVLSKAIQSKTFIGSPLALLNLIKVTCRMIFLLYIG